MRRSRCDERSKLVDSSEILAADVRVLAHVCDRSCERRRGIRVWIKEDGVEVGVVGHAAAAAHDEKVAERDAEDKEVQNADAEGDVDEQ